MEIKPYTHETDFEIIKDWVTDARTHAMWCANRFEFPLSKENVAKVLEENVNNYGEVAFVATVDGKLAGFFCYSTNSETNEGMLKYVVVNPDFRGTGAAGEMLRLAAVYAFEKEGAEALQLNVYPENVRAKKCYEKAGFVERKTTENALTFGDESWSRCNMVLTKVDF